MLLKKLIAIVLVLYLAFVLLGTLLLSHCKLADGGKAPDFSAIEDTAERKKAFFAYLKPIVDRQNEYLSEERQRLLALQDKNAPLSKREKKPFET